MALFYSHRLDLPFEQISLFELGKSIERYQDEQNNIAAPVARLNILTYNINKDSKSPALEDLSLFLPYGARYLRLTQLHKLEGITKLGARDFVEMGEALPLFAIQLMQEWSEGLRHIATN